MIWALLFIGLVLFGKSTALSGLSPGPAKAARQA